jgi:hypothetical protein
LSLKAGGAAVGGRSRFRHLCQRGYCVRNFWAAYILLGLRYSGEPVAQVLRGVVSMKEPSTYQAILQEGEVRGEVREARKLLRKSAERAFGPPDAQTAAALEQIHDLARLEALFDRVETVGSWQELLGPQTPNGGRGRRRRSS